MLHFVFPSCLAEMLAPSAMSSSRWARKKGRTNESEGLRTLVRTKVCDSLCIFPVMSHLSVVTQVGGIGGKQICLSTMCQVPCRTHLKSCCTCSGNAMAAGHFSGIGGNSGPSASTKQQCPKLRQMNPRCYSNLNGDLRITEILYHPITRHPRTK